MAKSYRLPTKINVYGADYTIKLVPLEDCDGLIYPIKREILVDSSLDFHARMFALMHELGHAVVYETGIYETLDPNTEEIMLTNISKLFANLFFKK